MLRYAILRLLFYISVEDTSGILWNLVMVFNYVERYSNFWRFYTFDLFRDIGVRLTTLDGCQSDCKMQVHGGVAHKRSIIEAYQN